MKRIIKYMFLGVLVCSMATMLEAKKMIILKNYTGSNLFLTNSCNLAITGSLKQKNPSEDIPIVLTEDLTPEETFQQDNVQIVKDHSVCLQRLASVDQAHICAAEQSMALGALAIRVQQLATLECELGIMAEDSAKRVVIKINPFTFNIISEKREGLLLQAGKKTNGEPDLTVLEVRLDTKQ